MGNLPSCIAFRAPDVALCGSSDFDLRTLVVLVVWNYQYILARGFRCLVDVYACARLGNGTAWIRNVWATTDIDVSWRFMVGPTNLWWEII